MHLQRIKMIDKISERRDQVPCPRHVVGALTRHISRQTSHEPRWLPAKGICVARRVRVEVRRLRLSNAQHARTPAGRCQQRVKRGREIRGLSDAHTHTHAPTHPHTHTQPPAHWTRISPFLPREFIQDFRKHELATIAYLSLRFTMTHHGEPGAPTRP